MKRFLPFLLIAALLAGCSAFNNTEVPTPDDSTISTQVAQILTTMPTSTIAVQGSNPTQQLPTIPVTVVPANTATQPPAQDAATAQPPTPTETVAPTETATAAPTATGQPTATIAFTPPPGDPINQLGNPTWVDDMNDGKNWPLGTDKYTSLDFSNGVMSLTGLTTTDGWRLTTPLLTNFYLEVTFQTTTCGGDDRYGVFVRVPDATNADRGYLLGFSCDGQYSLRRWNAEIGAKGEMINLIDWTKSDAINSGQNQTNRMGLMAVGDRLIVYANGKMLKEADDNMFSQGYFGVFIGARETENLTVRVDQVRYWDNPTP